MTNAVALIIVDKTMGAAPRGASRRARERLPAYRRREKDDDEEEYTLLADRENASPAGRAFQRRNVERGF